MFVFIAAVLAGYLLTPRGGPGPVTTQDRPGAIDVPPDMLLLSLQRAAAKNPKDIPTFLILARGTFRSWGGLRCDRHVCAGSGD